MISHAHKCIFIHVPKCAGTSMEAYLREYAGALGYLPEPGLDRILRREGLAEMLNRHPDYFVFAFVRHPFARLASAWRHGRRGVGPYYDRPVRDLSLAEYVQIAAEGRHAEQSAFDRYHLMPQVTFIPDTSRRTLFGVPLKPEVSCHFIGRFEHLEDDFRRVCLHLGIPLRPFPRLLEAPQDSGGGNDLLDYPQDTETARLVETLYREDMAAFGYGPSPRTVRG